MVTISQLRGKSIVVDLLKSVSQPLWSGRRVVLYDATTRS